MTRATIWAVVCICVVLVGSAKGQDRDTPPDPREASGAAPTTSAPAVPPAPGLAASQSAAPTTRPASPASRPTAEATSEPGEAEDKRRTPRGTMEEFLQAVGESEENPERIKDAVACLDLSEMTRDNPRVAERRGPVLARQLNEVIEALLNIYGKTRWEIPREPKGDRVVFPAKGEIQLVMVRGEDGLWRFNADTLTLLPKFRDTIKQKKEALEKESPGSEAAAGVPAEYRSARATMRTFLEAMARGDKEAAARCLDLSDQSAATVGETGEKLADQLQYAMDRINPVVYQDIPSRPDGEPYVWHLSEHGRIELARQDSGDRKGQWLFTKTTVKSIEPLFKAYQDRPRLRTGKGPAFLNNPRLWLLETLPSRLKEEVFGMQVWHWLGLAILIVLSYVVFRGALLLFSRMARSIGRTGFAEALPAGLKGSLRPLATLVMVVTWWAGLQLLLIPTEVLQYVWPALKFVMTAAGVWASYRLIDLVSAVVTAMAARTPSRLDDVLVPLLRKSAKIVVIAFGLLFILKALGAEKDTIEKLFAGLGIGGLAFALAAQESLKNFFGSITVVLDRPFQVGDWVKIGSVEGTVESVGLRSSRIRTFYDSQVIVPNSDLTTATIDNLGRRRYRRTNCKLSVEYSTSPELLEAFCEGVRELIRRHPHTRKDLYNVWVAEFAPSSIDVLLDCFHEIPEGVSEPEERHRLFLDIIRLAARLGVEFAFPTRTVMLAGGAGDSGQTGAAAEAPVVRPAQAAPKGAGRVAEERGDPMAWGRTMAADIARETMRHRQRPSAEGEPSEVD